VTDFMNSDAYGSLPAIAWDPIEGFGLFWIGSDAEANTENLFFAKLNNVGQMISSPKLMTNHASCDCITAYAPNVSFDSRFAVVWIDDKVINGEQAGPILRFAIVDKNGGKIRDIEITSPAENVSVERPRIKRVLNNFLVGWTDTSGTQYIAKLDNDATFTLNKKIALDYEWDLFNPQIQNTVVSENGKIYYVTGSDTKELVNTVKGENRNPFISFGNKLIIVWDNVMEGGNRQIYFGSLP
jgi:hypothetical protein